MGVSVLVRPTGAIMWPPIVLAQYYIDRKHFFHILKETIVMGYALVSVMYAHK